jgi:hypothetical protein
MCPVGQASVEGQCIEIEPFKHMNLITDFFFFLLSKQVKVVPLGIMSAMI